MFPLPAVVTCATRAYWIAYSRVDRQQCSGSQLSRRVSQMMPSAMLSMHGGAISNASTIPRLCGPRKLSLTTVLVNFWLLLDPLLPWLALRSLFNRHGTDGRNIVETYLSFYSLSIFRLYKSWRRRHQINVQQRRLIPNLRHWQNAHEHLPSQQLLLSFLLHKLQLPRHISPYPLLSPLRKLSRSLRHHYLNPRHHFHSLNHSLLHHHLDHPMCMQCQHVLLRCQLWPSTQPTTQPHVILQRLGIFHLQLRISHLQLHIQLLP